MFLFYAFVLVSVFNLSQLFSLSFCMFQMNYAFFNGKLYFFPDVHIHLIFLFKCICPTKQWWFLFCSSLFLPPDLFSLFSPGRYKFTKRGTNSEVCSNIFLFVYVILSSDVDMSGTNLCCRKSRISKFWIKNDICQILGGVPKKNRLINLPTNQ